MWSLDTVWLHSRVDMADTAHFLVKVAAVVRDSILTVVALSTSMDERTFDGRH